MEKIIVGIIIGLVIGYVSDIKKSSSEKGVIIKIYKHQAPKQRERREFIEYDNSITFED